MSAIEGICFDLGSTLLRFDGSWNQATIQRGMDQMIASLEQHAHLGRPFRAAFLQALDESRTAREVDFMERCTRDTLQEVFLQHTGTRLPEHALDTAMRELYSITRMSWQEMPGMRQVLENLHSSGYRLGLISNAADAQDVQHMLDHFAIRQYFDPILISAEVRYRKPHPKIFDMLLQAWDLPPQTLVMVGDTLNADIHGAQQAGMHQIWLERPLRSHEDPADREQIHPELTAAALLEIPALIQSLS